MKNPVSFKLKINKAFTLLWAFAILWFYVGDLVNFHQNRIWGTQLIPACFIHSSVNTKDSALFAPPGEDSPSFNFIGFAEDAKISFATNLFPVTSRICYAYGESITSSFLSSSHMLRAPPLS